MGDEQEPRNETGSILDDEQITVTLAGKEYVWKMPGNRQRRLICTELAKAVDGVTVDNPLAMFEVALDFFYANHKGMKADKQHIDDKADEPEILRVFKEVSDFLNDPLVRRMREVAEQYPQKPSDDNKK